MKTAKNLFLAALFCSVGMLASVPAHALDPYGVPQISCGDATLGSITLNVCGDATTGAPAGVTIQWKKKSDFLLTGWSDDGLCKLSLSGQPSLQHPEKSRWELLPGECEEIIIGGIIADETGLSVTGTGCGVDDLECGTEYVFRWFAHAGRGFGRSDWGGEIVCSTDPCGPTQCTHTWGYWKTHGPTGCVNGNNSNEWPANSLTLGNVNYTAAQLCCIFQATPGGNGLIQLAHQLISAKFSVLSGATNCPEVAQAIADADAMIGNLVVPSSPANCTNGAGSLPGGAGGLVLTLDTYNNGGLCSPNCHGGAPQKAGESPNATTGTRHSSWGDLKIHHQ